MRVDEAPDPVEEPGGALDSAVVPVQILLGRRREEGEQAGGVGPVAPDQLVRVDHIALRLRHLRAVLDDHALRQERGEGLVRRDHAEVAQHLGEEARVQEMEHGVLDAADVLVDGHPVLRRLAVEHALIESRRAIAEEIPGRLDERVHRVGVAPRRSPAPRAARVHEARDFGQRRPALAADLHVLGQDDGQTVLALRHHAARRAVHDGDRRAPVALAADAPVAQAIVDLGAPDALGDEPVDGLPHGVGDTESVEEARVDLDPVTRVRLCLLPVRRPLHRRHDGQPVLHGEVPVALVLPGDRHDRAGAIAHQHVVGEEERDLLPVERVDRPRAQPQAPLGPVGGEALDLGLPRHLLAEARHLVPLLRIRHQRFDQWVLRRQHRVGHPEGGVRARGEDRERHVTASGHGQVEFGPLAPPDPVALHRHDALGPAGQPIAPLEQLLGVVGDLEEPALDVLGDHLGIAAPAAARLDLLVGENRLAGWAPVDGRALLVREPALEHADEDELLPAVVRRIAGGELPVPVVGDAHAPELRAHVLDVLVGPHRRMDAVVDGGVLGGQPEGIPAHRVQYVEAPHPLEPGEQIPDGIHPNMPHVDAAGGIREHLEAVVLRTAGLLRHLELLGVLPDRLPLGLDLAKRVSVLAVVE